jgi:hypothetical protein
MLTLFVQARLFLADVKKLFYAILLTVIITALASFIPLYRVQFSHQVQELLA